MGNGTVRCSQHGQEQRDRKIPAQVSEYARVKRQSCERRFSPHASRFRNPLSAPTLLQRTKILSAVHILYALEIRPFADLSLLCALTALSLSPSVKFTSASRVTLVVPLVFFMVPANYVRGKRSPIMLNPLSLLSVPYILQNRFLVPTLRRQRQNRTTRFENMDSRDERFTFSFYVLSVRRFEPRAISRY